jgi:hypothetical protein
MEQLIHQVKIKESLYKMSNSNRPELIPQPAYPDWPPVERSLGGKTANIGNQFDWVKHRCQIWGSLLCEVPNLLWDSTGIAVGRVPECLSSPTTLVNDNTSFEDIATLCKNVSTVGTNGGPSAYGTYDQNGNVQEWVDAGTATITSTTQAEEVNVAGGFSLPGRNINPVVMLNTANFNLRVEEQWIGQVNIRQTGIGSVQGSAPIPKVYDLLDKDGSVINYFDLLSNQGLFPIRIKIVGDNSINRKNYVYFFCAENHRFPGSLVTWEFDSTWNFVRSLPLAKRTNNNSPISSYARTILDMYDFETSFFGPGDGIRIFFNPVDTFNRFEGNGRIIEIVKRFKNQEFKPIDLTPLGVDDIGTQETVAAALAGGGYDTDAISSDVNLNTWKYINPLPTKAYGTDRAGFFVNNILPGESTLARPKHDVLPVPLGFGFRIATRDNPYNYPNFVTVEDLNNEANEITGHGSVSYEYKIGKFLVTNDEYAEFLNIVGGVGQWGLYDARMAFGENPVDGLFGGQRTFRVNGIIYSKRYNKFMPNEGYSGKPVYWVSYYSAMRYCNWLHHGKPKNNASSLINSGAYNISGSALNDSNITPTQRIFTPISQEVFFARKTRDAKYYIPTIDEWYKAAFYKGNQQ